MNQKNFKFIDLFAGIGGLRMPFSDQGECVFTSEIDKYARKTYLANYRDDKFPINQDITKIDPQGVPNHDLLLAGFPCQPFSKAGKRQGFEDTEARGTLFFNIVDILRSKRPAMFLLENVATLRTQNKGQIFERLLDELGHKNRTLFDARNDIDYEVVSVTLNSRQFNVPQNRRRLFLLGLSRDVYPEDIRMQIKSLIKGLEKYEHVTTKLSDVLMDHPHTGKLSDYVISKRLWSSHKRRKKENIKNGKGFGYSVVTKASAYTRTMSARYYKDGSEILVGIEGAHKNRCPRMLFPREVARLQGFPDSYIINKVSRTQIYKQFGNSVCVPIIKEISNIIIPYL
jgi:DNA (cytosine-5)-methyltransferase 1